MKFNIMSNIEIVFFDHLNSKLHNSTDSKTIVKLFVNFSNNIPNNSFLRIPIEDALITGILNGKDGI